MRLKFFVTLGLCLLNSPALAWNQAGHMVVAAIAYDVLKQQHPETIEKVVAAMKGHPEYDSILSHRLEAVPEADRDCYLFMIAARWPDDIRNKPEFTHPFWHYVDFPFVPEGHAASVPASQPADENLLTALKEQNSILSSTTAPADKRGISVCWIMHLVGDVHQPLHAVSLFSDEFPHGDKGGNAIYVRPQEGGEILNLHRLWDGLLIGSDKFTDIRNEATDLEHRPELQLSNLTELQDNDPKDWASAESFKAAVTFAYLNGQLPHGSQNDAPVLPEGYLKAAKGVAERRAVLAGIRLAGMLQADLGQK